jgi:phenylglyoxylate dehydrogenase epsilon subunit
MAKRRQVIVGSGSAAISALRQLRKAGCEDEVLVLTMETHDPYSPMSLPYVVLGKMTRSDIRMVPGDFFSRMNAVFSRERKVISIQPAARSLILEDGGTEQYDRLLIATGSDPIMPAVLREPGAMGFHVLDDCLALERELTQRKSIAIIGAGLVGMEMASALAAKGHEVTVVAPRERILRNYFDLETSHRIIDLFAAAGVAVKLNWGEAVKSEKRGSKTIVRFEGGDQIEADVLLACLGVRPRMDLVRGSGIETNAGICVDRQMRTSVPGIFAAGDCAEAHDFFSGRNVVNPILPSAVAQGKVAGDNMADRACEYEGSLAMNTFSFFDHLAVSVGMAAASPGDDVLVHTQNGTYARLVFSRDTLTGASFLDADVDPGVIQYLIRRKVPIGKYRTMLVEKTREVAFWLMNEAERQETVSREE